ncbi:hypothetical protein O0544_18300 [Edwardsiella anguillarum]|nr:hypothetical protein [Edwardsiella anguillarum]
MARAPPIFPCKTDTAYVSLRTAGHRQSRGQCRHHQGFIPAAQRLDLPVLLLTDRAAEHRACLAGPVTVVECDVFNPLAILDTLTALGVTPAPSSPTATTCRAPAPSPPPR